MDPTLDWLNALFIPLMNASYGIMREMYAKQSKKSGVKHCGPNYVSLLEEWKTKNKTRVEYRDSEETGPNHAPVFSGSVWVGGVLCGEASGAANKKELKQLLVVFFSFHPN